MNFDSTPMSIDESARRRFEAAWRDGSPEAIEDVLPPADHPQYRTTLKELVLIEIELWWKRYGRTEPGGTQVLESAQVERYLQRFPVLNEAAVVLDLLRQEFLARQQSGDQPNASEYCRRFPALVATGQEVAVTLSGKALDAEGLSPVCLRELGQATPTWEPPPFTGMRPPRHHLPERYKVEGEIARGGMGAILKGRDVDLGRDIAIKVLLEKHLDEAELVQRFVEEARIGGQLQHPGIVPVYELGRQESPQPYFTMKLVKGRTLAALLKVRAASGGREPPDVRHQPPDTSPHQGADAPRSPEHGALTQPRSLDDLPRFLGIFEQVCQTMAYAHARSVIHRDLKPTNIMVGAFGEVQVMDWGLAKVLLKKDDEASPAEQSPEGSTVIHTKRGRITEKRNADADTEAGSVLGTPAYMAPEQARGEIAKVDERADVFGLGAILCEILTGQPPFLEMNGEAVLVQAVRGKLEGAWERLDRCEADPELIALARRCLEPDLGRRLRQAGEVAAAMTAYLQSVQQKLRKAELERAQAEVQAAEEHQRRLVERQKQRVQLALAAVLLLLLTGASAAGWLYLQNQAAWEMAKADHRAETAKRDAEEAKHQSDQDTTRKYVTEELLSALAEAEKQKEKLHEQLADPVQAAVLLSDLDQWENVLENMRKALKRAKAAAAGNQALLAKNLLDHLAEHDATLQADNKHFQWAKKLDDIRLGGAELTEGWFDLSRVGPKYAKFFAGELKLDLKQGDPKQIAAWIGKSPIRFALVAALDHWALAIQFSKKQDPNLVRQLLEAARHADPDPWRNKFRDEQVWHNLKKMRKLAAEVQPASQSPQFLAALAHKLKMSGGDPVPLLRLAAVHHPKDFWLNFELGLQTKNHAEAVGYYLAALAVRPRSEVVYNALGNVLFWQGDLPAAVVAYQKAVQLNDNFPNAHTALGMALAAQNDFEGAIPHYQKALKLNPEASHTFFCWGCALVQKDPAQAILKFKKAIQLQPTQYPEFYCHLGLTLQAQGEFAEALAALKKGHELGSMKTQWPLPSAHWVQFCERLIDLDKQLPAFLQGQAQPKDALELLEVANLCHKYKKLPAAAVRFYQKAFAQKSNLALHDQYQAACAAALAAAGQGKDADNISDKDKAKLRAQALAWLRAELAALTRELQMNPQAAEQVEKQLQQWHIEPSLVGLRAAKALAKLPNTEQQDWQQFWAAVDKILQEAQK